MNSNMLAIQQNRLGALSRKESVECVQKRNVGLHLALISAIPVMCLLGNFESSLLQQLKAASRLGSLGALIGLNLICVKRTNLQTVLFYLTGFILFFCFGVMSVAWSPLPTYSLTQLVSLVWLLVLAGTIARLSNSSKHAEIVCVYLLVTLAIRSVMMLGVNAIMGGTAIMRGQVHQVWHSTDAADTGSVGLLILACCFFIFNFKWAKAIGLPCLLLFGLLLVVASNRISMVLSPAAILACLLFAGNRKLLFWIFFSIAVFVPFIMVLDAQMDLAGKLLGMTSSVANRDGPDDAFRTFSGRTELWAYVWNEFYNSKFVGQGYMVTSAIGKFEVWHQVHNWDAHNQVLHLLATTGLIGFSLFAMGMMSPFILIKRHIWKRDDQGDIARSATIIICWLLIWGLLNVSFSGYINVCGVAFFVILGMVIGVLRPNAKAECIQQAMQGND